MDHNAIMWQLEASQIGIKARRGGQKAAMKWIIPDDTNQHQELCSPVFFNLAKKWRIHLKKQEVLLEYNQWLEEVVAFMRDRTVLLAVRFISGQPTIRDLLEEQDVSV
ncbi:uncharacterized protein LOC144652314 isoform X4 [Oculina patagonica]